MNSILTTSILRYALLLYALHSVTDSTLEYMTIFQRVTGSTSECYWQQLYYILLLSVYSPFSDRVGLSLYNIPSPLLSVMDIFFVDLKFCHIRFYTL